MIKWMITESQEQQLRAVLEIAGKSTNLEGMKIVVALGDSLAEAVAEAQKKNDVPKENRE